jgi:hypothetical protein
MSSVLPAALPRGQEDGAFVGRAPFSSRSSRRRVTRGCGSVERRRSPPATVLPSARRRGWEDRQRAPARWQEGVGGSRRTAPPAAGCAITDRIARSSAYAGLPSHPCPPAAMLDACRLSSQPRCHAARRTVLLLGAPLFLRALRGVARHEVAAALSADDRPSRPSSRPRLGAVTRTARHGAVFASPPVSLLRRCAAPRITISAAWTMRRRSSTAPRG